MTEQETIEAELIQCFHDFYRAYAQRGDGVVEALRERISPELTGFGTGRDERMTDRSAMIRILREELRQQPDPFSIEFIWTEARLLSPSVGVVDTEAVATVTVGDGKSVSFDLRITGVFRNENGTWCLTYNHGSMPAYEQAEGERMPIDGLKARNQELERLVVERTASLRKAQAQLVHQEKMASLGALTAGIAHEIKNPLNFVNNFAALSQELVDELEAETDPEEIQAILADLKTNATKIREHGQRADGIVRSMMQHASGSTGQREATDVNALVSEHIELAYHGKRAQMPDFNAEMEQDLGADVGRVEMVPQEIGRVLLNLVGNAFDAVYERAASVNGGSVPQVSVSTRRLGDQVEIRVADNGPGIPDEVKERIFEPFFTTKPTGSGTGLGLSLSYDIVTQGHGGTLHVESEEGQGAVFIVTLPAP